MPKVLLNPQLSQAILVLGKFELETVAAILKPQRKGDCIYILKSLP